MEPIDTLTGPSATDEKTRLFPIFNAGCQGFESYPHSSQAGAPHDTSHPSRTRPAPPATRWKLFTVPKCTSRLANSSFGKGKVGLAGNRILRVTDHRINQQRHGVLQAWNIPPNRVLSWSKWMIYRKSGRSEGLARQGHNATGRPPLRNRFGSANKDTPRSPVSRLLNSALVPAYL
ncbi:hypothetical protein N7468_004618 [Penicillium chermesinum]|uniref:Uncharacterized protein n=1 Tax=Penicillium chermesinum TaxID=63820 RepID=A0A9W9P8W7_9EURO|nr:uncharacterized protein N7468_004618 [Penicillium chermesinum]KAJ5239999.1 hypothetical protein N7468_004618 [Penicillium chermesinum]